MSTSYGLAEAKSRGIKFFNKLASDQIKILLETKHLYQRVPIDPSGEMVALSEAIHSARADETLLEEGMREIDRHFKIRNAFNLGDVSEAHSRP